MPAAMRCSRWSGLPAKMIWTRRICQSKNGGESTPRVALRLGQANGQDRSILDRPGGQQWQRDANWHMSQQSPSLTAEASAALREQLLAEIAGLASPDQLDSWALRGLPAKNTLTAADAGLVEEAFRDKIGRLNVGHRQRPTEAPHNSERKRLAAIRFGG